MANVAHEFKLNETKDAELLQDAQKLLNLLWTLPESKRYVPCPNPSNLERKDLPLLQSQEYVVSPKLDGIRFFLLLGEMENSETKYSVFISRSFQVFPVTLSVKHNELYDGTLLDGEMTRTVSGRVVYTVFDAITVEGYDLKSFPFSERKEAYEGALKAIYPPQGLLIDTKKWYPREDALQVYTENSEDCDGLILQPLEGKLKAGILADVFKWKPTESQTIDFYLSLSEAGQVCLECGHGSEMIVAKSVHCSYDDQVPLAFHLSGTRKVFECVLSRVDDNTLYFIPIKPRGDKVYANDVRVVVSTLKSIQEDIRVEELCD